MRKIAVCGLITMLLILAGCSDSPDSVKLDHYGIYILPKSSQPVELTTPKDVDDLYTFVMQCKFFAAESRLVVYRKQFNPSDVELVYLGDARGTGALENAVVDVVVTPMGSERYQVTPKSPLHEGIYMCGDRSVKTAYCFGIGGKNMEDAIKEAFKTQLDEAQEESQSTRDP